jgi:hypothetical protein
VAVTPRRIRDENWLSGRRQQRSAESRKHGDGSHGTHVRAASTVDTKVRPVIVVSRADIPVAPCQ